MVESRIYLLAMGKKSTKPKATTGPSLEELSKLAQSLTRERDSAPPPDPDLPKKDDGKKRRVTKKSTEEKGLEMPPPPVPPKKRSKPDAKSDGSEPDGTPKAEELSRKKSKIFSDGDRVRFENFDPQSLPFEMVWENYDKLKDLFELDDSECTSVLLAAVGPTPEGKAFWSKFDLPPIYANQLLKTTPPKKDGEDAKAEDENVDGENLETDSDFEDDDSLSAEFPPMKIAAPSAVKVEDPKEPLNQAALDARNKLDAVKTMPTPSKSEPC